MDSSFNTYLPVLTFYNYSEYKLWHEYYFKVYGEIIAPNQRVDLNKFTWFYNYAPLNVNSTLAKFNELDKYPNNAFLRYDNTDYWNNVGKNEISPEDIVSKNGYFVKKPIDNSYFNKNYIEVLRTNLGQGSKETTKAWFYHTIGSGFWIQKKNIIEIKKNINNKKKTHLTEIIMDTGNKMANDLDIDIYYGSEYNKKLANIIYKNGIITNL